MGHCKSSAKWRINCNTGLPQETRNKSNNQLNSTPKATRKGINEEPQGQQKERIIKIRAEVNSKDTKEAVAKINKAKSSVFEKIK